MYIKLYKYLFAVILALAFIVFSDQAGSVNAQQAPTCGASTCTGSCSVINNSCVLTGRSCSWKDCSCSATSPQTGCRGGYTSVCDAYETSCRDQPATCYNCVNYTCPVQNGKGDSNDVYAATCRRCTAYSCTSRVCSSSCVASHNELTSCSVVNQNIACGRPPGPPTCTAQTSCTPTCPAGKVPYDTGSGTTTTASCTYETGNIVGNNCQTSSVTSPCWNELTPPVVTITNLDNVSNNGCTAAAGYMGKDANNTNRVRVDFADNNNANPYNALQVWFADGSATPPSISKVYDSGTGDLLSNGSYGFLVRKNGANWNDIYVPGVENGSTPTWVKAGTIGTGLRADILGANSQKLMGIKDVTVVTNGTTVILRFTVQYYHEDSGITGYEKAKEGNVTIYTSANARDSFLPSGGNTITTIPQWVDSGRSWVLDLTAPTSDKLNVSILDATHLNVDWKYSDSGSSVIRVVGDASIANQTGTPDNIDDETSGVSNYVLGSGSTGANLYRGTHLWRTPLDLRVDRIDMNNNQSGTVTFTSNAFDSACNTASATANFPFGVAWIATKGGFVNAGSSSGLQIIPLSGHSGFSNDSYWNSPFAFYKNETDISSELVSASSTSINSLLHPNVGAVRSFNHFDNNNRQNYWYAELLRRTDLKVAQDSTKFVVVNNASDTTVSGSSTNIGSCTTSKGCVVKVSGNLTVNSGFVCNTQTVFLTSGTTTLNGDITAPNQNDGCMFVSKGDIVVGAGTYKSGSSTYPMYDIVEAYMISDGIIDIPLVDSTRTVKDGLLVHGSMLGFGSTTGSSFRLARTLRTVHNSTFPVLAIHFDNRYVGFAPLFFGGETEGFRREVGYKPL